MPGESCKGEARRGADGPVGDVFGGGERHGGAVEPNGGGGVDQDPAELAYHS